MKLLRKTIRNLIMENASIIDTNVVSLMEKNHLIIVADMHPDGFDSTVYVCNASDYDEEYGEVSNSLGSIAIGNIGNETYEVTGSVLSSAYRNKGLGALLYNTILALSTSAGYWMMADRMDVSGDASRIWDTWKDMHDVYEIDQTDHKQPDETHGATPFNDYDPDVDFFLTKSRDDDFTQDSFQDNDANFGSYSDDDPRAQWGDMIKDWWYFFDDDYREDFLASGLTKRYKMKDPQGFIRKLKDHDLLRFIGEVV